MDFVSEGKADFKKFQKRAMLKDFLLSSSSSNGFISFPRHPAAMLMPMPPSRSGGSCAASALRRASERVINAVKRIPFYSVISPSSSSARPKQASSILRRSLSQRLKRRFWKRKKTDAAIRKSCSWKGSLLLENSNSSSMSSCSWLGSDCSSAQSSSGSSEYFGGSEGIFGKNDQLTPCSNRSTQRGGVGDDSPGGETKKQEQQQSLEGIAGLDDGKEQLSPVSVLNRHACDDEESPSPTSPINEEENHNNRIHKKFRLFRIASQMGPTNLYNQFFSRSDVEEDEESNKIAANAKDLLNSFRASHGQARKGSAAIERLMLEFFREGWWKGEEKLLGAASSWMRDGVTGLGVEDNKEAYVEGMEEGGRWRGFALEEDELVLETEAWLLVSLLEELMLDLL